MKKLVIAKEIAKAAQNTSSNANQLFVELFERWQDEKGMESFSTYKTALKAALAKEGLTMIDFKRRPFAYVVQLYTDNGAIASKALQVTLDSVSSQFNYKVINL